MPRSRLVLLPLACALAQAFAPRPAAAQALPAHGSVAAGQVSWQTEAPGRMSVQQTSQRAVIDWQSFSVGAGAQVTFQQPNAQAAVLNRVTGDARSDIAGRIGANGQFFLVNPNGIQLTPTGSIQAAGIVLSTLDIRNDDFMAGATLGFEGRGASAEIVNRGMLIGAAGGFAALLGGRVANDGHIEVPLGRVALGAGERATLDLNGNGLLQVALPGRSADDGRALIDVAGRIVADGGRIELSAATAREALRQAIHLPGELQARSVAGRSGEIVLAAGDGGAVALAGRLDASGERGGAITVTGDAIELRGARLDVSGAAGAGRIAIGGGRQGQGALPHARMVAIDAASRLDASATADGAGGDVVVWSDGGTAFEGAIVARGAGTGRGGEAEVSGLQRLDYRGSADLRAASGLTGTLLLDPYNVTISTGANTGAGFTAGANDTVINTTTLATALGTANVTVSTGSGGAQAGNITVSNPVTWSGGTTLTLNAAGSIASNAALTASAGGGVAMNAGGDITVANGAHITTGGAPLNIAFAPAGRLTINAATLATGGGTLIANATGSTTNTGLTLNGSTIQVGAGSATLAGSSANGFGASIGGNAALTAAAGGSITVTGTQTAISTVAQGAGLQIDVNAALSTSGNVALFGNGSVSTAGHGLMLRLGASIVSQGGSLSLSGSTAAANTARHGLNVSGGNTVSAQAGSVGLAGSTSGTGLGAMVAGTVNLNNPGGGSFALTGSSGSSIGLQFNGTTLGLTGTGSMTLSGSSTSGTGLYWLNANAVTLSSGSVAFAGSSTSSRGQWFNNTGNTFANLGAGSLQLTGSTASATGTQYGLGFNGSLTLGTTGNVGFVGTASAGAYGVWLNTGHTLNASGGAATITGSTVSGSGLRIEGGSNALNAAANGSIALQGSASASGHGIVLNTGASLATSGTVSLAGSTLAGGTNRYGLQFGSGAGATASSGSLALNGSALASTGIYFTSTNSLNANGGAVTATGSSVTGTGIGFQPGSYTLTAATGSGLALAGSASGVGNGIVLVAASSLATSGAVSLTGSTAATVGATPNRYGVHFGAGTSVSTSGGALGIHGTASSNAAGLYTAGDLHLTQAGTGSFALTGASASGIGVRLGGGTLTTHGTLGIASVASRLVIEAGETVSVAAGSLSITGDGPAGFAGISIKAAVNLVNTAGGGLSLVGTSSGYRGIELQAGSSLGVVGPVGLSGSSTTGVGIDIDGTITVTSGALALSGSSASGIGVNQTSFVSALVNLGSGTLSIDAPSGGMSFGNPVTSSTGVLSLSGAGLIVQTGSSAIVAGQLRVSGSAAYSLAGSGNQIGSIAGHAGSIDVYSATALSVGSVLGTSGLTTTGQPIVRSGAGLTIAGGAGVHGANPVLVAAGGFHNAAGAAAVTASSGRWLIYASSPAASSFGGLDSGHAALWHATYALAPPAGVTASGHRYLFAEQPTVTFTATSGVKTYGDDASAVLASGYAVSGLHGGVGGAFAADTAAGVFSGMPSITSAGATPAATVAGGPYAITAGAGTVVTLTGYATAFVDGLLVVTPRPITVTADAQGRVYGDANPALTARVTGGRLVNGDALSGTLATAAGSASPVGSYAITQGTLAASADYALTYAGANLAVTPRPITVTADALSRRYGDANPALTAQLTSGNLVGGDALAGALATAAGAASDVGLYAITQGSLDAGANYRLDVIPATLTVLPRALTVVAASQARAQGSANPVLGYTAVGLVGSDALVGAPNTPANPASPVGAYAIDQGSLAAGPNYALAFQPGVLLVVPGKPAVRSAGERIERPGSGDAACIARPATHTAHANCIVGP